MASNGKAVSLQMITLIVTMFVIVGLISPTLSLASGGVRAATGDSGKITFADTDCQAITGGNNPGCAGYTITLTRIDNLTSTVHIEPGITPLDEVLLNGYINECLSMTSASYAACTAYALDLMSSNSR